MTRRFQVGDLVKVVKKCDFNKVTEDNSWISWMDDYIGKNEFVTGVSGYGIQLYGTSYLYPSESLELITPIEERPKPSRISTAAIEEGDFVVQIESSTLHEHDFPPYKYPELQVKTIKHGTGISFYNVPGKADGSDVSRFKLVRKGNSVMTGKGATVGLPATTEQSQCLGAKYDGGKINFRALTRGLAIPLRAVAAVLTYGAQKYKEDSWQTVPDGKARYEAALDRHLNDWKRGEACDPESGLPHLAHAACNALFILWFELQDWVGDYTKFNKPPKE